MKVYFVGAGPGATDLITVRGRTLLEQADIVIYAGSLVSSGHLKFCRPETRLMDSAHMNLEEIASVYRSEKQNRGIIVRLHTGDPAVYGAIQEQMDILASEQIPFETVPGVSSFQAASAALGRQFTLPGVTQSVILTRVDGRTPVPASESLEQLARSGATLVIFLSADRAEEIQRRLEPVLGADTPTAIVYRATWEEEKVFTGSLGGLTQLSESSGIRNHALIIVGRVLTSEYDKTKLYDAAFSHGYREGRP